MINKMPLIVPRDSICYLCNRKKNNGMNFSIKDIFSAFIVMFAVIDILGSVPIIIGMKEKKKSFSPLNAAVISFAILVAFLFLGQAMLGLFGVDISSFAVAGCACPSGSGN